MPPQDLAGLSPTATRILDAAKTIVAERGFAKLTMAEVEKESGANRALVAYYFGSKAGLVSALVDSLFQDSSSEPVEETQEDSEQSLRTVVFLEWQRRVSTNDRVNRMLYELLPQALKDQQVRARFADEYRLYRAIGADRLSSAPVKLTEEQADALAAVSIAVLEGLAIQRALDPDGFDHDKAWRCWRDVIGHYLELPES